MTGTVKGARARPKALRWAPWAAMAVVVISLLAVGSLGGEPQTNAERALALQETIRCPSCASQSVAHSNTPSAQGVKVLIRERIAAGNSDEEIRDYVASSYPDGRRLLLDPSGQGFSALLWGLPVAGAIVAVAGLAYRFGDWRPAGRSASAADRALVASARRGSGLGPGPSGTDDGPADGSDPVDQVDPVDPVEAG